ncbi:AAA family ATPase [Spirosoma aureum]|uniref:AAA family ATPase n=1 Tax=Spirosoma aureum TaxID=2692134 RepID=A0A6G9AQJ2_9BACT|nr:ATP-binding protein [Spirosoma aureum]QIP14762.1 AAA family ATPase [Spirosoma aureum]
MRIKIYTDQPPLTKFETDDLPDFVVITGINGVGKTALLKQLTRTLQARNTMGKNVTSPAVDIIDTTLTNNWVSLGADWPELKSATGNMMTYLTDMKALYEGFFKRELEGHQGPKPISDHLKAKGLDINNITFKEFDENYRPQTSIQNVSLASINQYFLTYKANYLSKINLRGWPHEKFVELYGDEPWDILNSLLANANLPYRITVPTEKDYSSTFHLTFIDIDGPTGHDNRIEPSYLSSGEKVIITLLLHVFVGQVNGEVPSLFLLDEPDAHLHPQLAKNFIENIVNTIVKKYGAKVIMTTHSPSTIAFAPESSIYEMTKYKTAILPSKSKSSTISLLTSGYLFVGEHTKYVLVEDKDDVSFYTTIYGHLNDVESLSRDRQIVFIPASTNEKSGGKTVVDNWVKKLVNSGLNTFIYGLIDEDAGNESSPNLFVLNRYSIENYLIDPILVYAVMLHFDKAPKIAGVNIAFGQEAKFTEMSSVELQLIADYIFNQVEPYLKAATLTNSPTIDYTPVEVEFIGGQKLNYPAWLLNCRGKDLISEVFLKAFTKNLYHFRNALLVLKKMHSVIPKEMITLFQSIQFSN